MSSEAFPSFISVIGAGASGDVGFSDNNDPGFMTFFCPAFAAASAPACRMAIVRGVSSFFGAVALDLRWASGGSRICMCSESDVGAAAALRLGADGGGSFETVGVMLTAGTVPTCCFNSPYSFHSSTSSRSYVFPQLAD